MYGLICLNGLVGIIGIVDIVSLLSLIGINSLTGLVRRRQAAAMVRVVTDIMMFEDLHWTL
jgi:hypothetical protein